MQHVPVYLDSFLDIDVVLVCCILAWMLSGFGLSGSELYQSPYLLLKLPTRLQKQGKTHAKKLLKLLMQAAAFISHMGTTEVSYQNKHGASQPDKVIRNTATLSAFNLQ